MMTKLEDLKHLAFSPLQMNVLRKAEKDGLNLEWLANTNLDYLQMEEIYLCLKYDVDPSSISDPDIPAESMRSLREHLFEMQGVYEDERIKINKQKTKLIILIVSFVLVLYSLIAVVYINRDYISLYFDDINLTLKADKVEIGMSKSFNPSDYIKEYDKRYDLTLPKNKKFEVPGEYTVIYKLSNKVKSIKKKLIVKVIDDIEPVLVLNKTNLTLEYGQNIDLKDYIEKAEDNIDGNLVEKVDYNQIDTSKPGNHVVTYSVKDKAGNHVSVEMSININEKPKVTEKSTNSNIENNVTTNKSNNSNNSNNSKSGQENIPSQFDKFFSGNSIDVYNQANSYAEEIFSSGKVKGFSVNPTGEGFQVSFS